MINKVSKETKNKILTKSAKGLPDNPSAMGMKPEEIKMAFYAPITDANSGLIGEIDRVVEEVNQAIENLGDLKDSNSCSEDEVKDIAYEILEKGYYNREEVDTLLDNVTPEGDLYTKTETDQAIKDAIDEMKDFAGMPLGFATLDINGKLNQNQLPEHGDIYTKAESDELLIQKADVDSVYQKSETYSKEETFNKGELKAIIPKIESLVKVKIFQNIEVQPGVWTENDNEDYPYLAQIPISGITTDDVVDVLFSIEDSTSGYYAPVTNTYNGGVTIYRKDTTDTVLTIPTIMCYLHAPQILYPIEVGDVMYTYLFNPSGKNADAMYAWFEGLSYNEVMRCPILQAEGVDMVYVVKFTDNYLLVVDNGHEDIVVYSHVADSVNGYSKGWQNLDTNNEVPIPDLKNGYTVTYVDNRGYWNTTVLGKKE